MHTQSAVRNSILAAKLAVNPDEVLRKQKILDDHLRQNDHARDSENFTGLLKAYVEFSLYPREIVYGLYEPITRACLTVVICLSCIAVGMETYPYFSNDSVLKGLDVFVYIVFCLEFVLKLMAEGAGPYRYFTGPNKYWNIFDFFLIFLTVPTEEGLFGSKVTRIGAISRICRLFRMLDVIRHIPALQVIMNGLHHGITSIFYIIILLVLVCYMYSVLGVFLFRESDPFNFGYVSRAMLALFRYCTVENWSGALYVTYYGCAEYDSEIYSVRSNYIDEAEWLKVPTMFRCTHPTKFYVFAYIYWLSFITVSFLIILSLFIGVVTLSMQTSLLEMKTESDEKAKKLRIAQAEKDFKAFYRSSVRSASDSRSSGAAVGAMRADGSGSSDNITTTSFIRRQASLLTSKLNPDGDGNDSTYKRKMSHQERTKHKDMEHMRKLLMTAWIGTTQSKQYMQELEDTHFDSAEHFSRWLGPKCRKLLEYNWFNFCSSVFIIFAGILIGIDADLGHSASKSEETFLHAMELIVLIVFSLELLIRLAADEFHIREFVKSKWNIFDFFVIVGSLVPQGGALVLLLRLFRLIRVLKLVRAFPRLVVIVGALIQGLSSIAYIGSFIMLQFYLFAITGTIIFGANDPFSFGRLHLSFLTLCKIATLDAWGDVMYKNIYGCDVYPNPEFASDLDVRYCDNPEAMPMTSVIYFLSFVLTGALVMLTLFVGVVTTSMEEATKAQLEEQVIEQEVRELCDSKQVSFDQLDIYKKVFALLDTDNGKVIEIDELRRGLEVIDLHPSMDELMTMLKDIDTNIDGVIDIVEFVAFMERMKDLNKDNAAADEQPHRAQSIVARSFSILEAIGDEVEDYFMQPQIKPSRSGSFGKPTRGGSFSAVGRTGTSTSSQKRNKNRSDSPGLIQDALEEVLQAEMARNRNELSNEELKECRAESYLSSPPVKQDAQNQMKVRMKLWMDSIVSDIDVDTVMAEMAQMSLNYAAEDKSASNHDSPLDTKQSKTAENEVIAFDVSPRASFENADEEGFGTEVDGISMKTFTTGGYTDAKRSY